MPNGRISRIKNPRLTVKNTRNKLIIFLVKIFFSLNNKNNVILNKVYTEKEFQKLREEIIKQMSSMPYLDKVGRRYEYGEFFPIELSPFTYNETLVQEFFPITKEVALERGYPWRDQNVKNFEITIAENKIPDNIDNVNEDILKEVLECVHKGNCHHQCNTAFKIADYEFKFYKKHE